MVSDEADFQDTSGPKGENFAEEERQRKLIFGSIALVAAIAGTLAILYAFGMTSAGVDEGGKEEPAQATKKK